MVQTCTKSEPKNQKKRMALIRSKPEPKVQRRLVLTCWKLEPSKEEEDNSKISKPELKEIMKDACNF